MTTQQLVDALNFEVAPLLEWMHTTVFSVQVETKSTAITHIIDVKILAEGKCYPGTDIRTVLAEASATSLEEADRKAVEKFWWKFDLMQDRINDLTTRFHQNMTIPDLSFEDSVWWAVHNKTNSRPEFELKAEISHGI